MENLRFEIYTMSHDKPDKKTKRYVVKSNHSDAILGLINWHSPWRQYVLETSNDIIWSWDCLQEASKFIKELMEARKRDK